ncbi:MAG TPA: hypothetical protein VJS92_06055, partial [Candidatus Polarisedimenticolaceae bacterium]|nr:hypothetical protein [Candidatus Polarisedimenticolaceae bacterium]
QLRRERVVPAERRPRNAPPRRAVAVPVRARHARFELLEAGEFVPFFVKGVNLGTALPGKFPGEFPDDERLYRDWLRQIGELGVNVVRLYTLHPPSLYRALAAHNRERPAQRLRLVQGVWTELPPGDDYGDARFDADFRAEIRRVIDAVHGNLELPARPGHAHGSYDADVSADLLVWLLGREWEPHSVTAYERAHPERTSYRDAYVEARRTRPFESWLASICGEAARHETESYGVQHPVGFVSWPTLDPLVHPTESSAREEWLLQGRRDPEPPAASHDEDVSQVDAARLQATPVFAAGLFASYHAYPYYPDFLLLESPPAATSRYLAYLQALARHHGEQPVLIAEFGVPSSRGIAHLQPEGQHHGGHTEREQGEIDARLLRDIDQAGLAGGILFAWMDEWFKRNWIVAPFEAPAERKPLWFNVLDAEETFGLLAAEPGAPESPVVLDGAGADWRDVPPLYAADAPSPLRALRARADEAYVYLELELDPAGGPIDWDRRQFWIGIDTYDERLGDHRFPPPISRTTPIGLEFLLQLAGAQGSRLLVDRPYFAHYGRHARPFRSEENDAGSFVEIVAVTNRERWGRDGTHYPARSYSRSVLRRGTDDLADWIDAPSGERIELRLPWGLLNITDPSSRQVVHERAPYETVVDTRTTAGLRFHVLALETRGGETRVVATLPERAASGAGDFPLFSWPTWEQPSYHLRRKQSYAVLQQELKTIPVPR